MKKNIIILILFFSLFEAIAQIAPDQAGYLMGLPQATDLTEIQAINNPQIGSIVYNNDDEKIYRYTGATNEWQAAGIQNSAEVNTVASTSDLNGDGTVDTLDIIDTDGDGVEETTVQRVLEAITPITSKAGRVFYPPSIEIDASAISTANETINLYTQYTAQYGAVIPANQRSTGAPNSIPIYTSDELYYYVTFADPTVFNIIGINDAGVLTYRIIGIPSNDNTLINVVFVVK